jgi:anaerobic C4-dicarboxylate transporter
LTRINAPDAVGAADGDFQRRLADGLAAINMDRTGTTHIGK